MVHCYKLGGLNIVLDICSGSVHVVDEAAYDMIEQYETADKDSLTAQVLAKYPTVTKEEVDECFAQIEALKEAGKLFTPDTFAPIADTLKRKTTGVVKALCLHVAHTCNLNCAYCFAGQGEYQGERGLMSFEVGKQALDFLIENSKEIGRASCRERV